jgi:hypothetical protein
MSCDMGFFVAKKSLFVLSNDKEETFFTKTTKT